MADTVYEKLYQITAENMKKAGGSFQNAEKTFLYFCENDPHQVDILKLYDIEADNREFVQIAYLAILNRTIDADAYRSWEKRFRLPEKKFRQMVINRITNSPETVHCHKRIYHNLFLYNKPRKNDQKKPGIVYRAAMKVYHKSPEAVKTVARKIAGVR